MMDGYRIHQPVGCGSLDSLCLCMHVRMCVCTYMNVRMRVLVYVCVSVCVNVRVYACAGQCASSMCAYVPVDVYVLYAS